jgi:hypothetical protein
MNVRPLHDRIVVRRLEDGEQNVGGIIIPDTAKEKPQRGTVIAAGIGAVRDGGARVPVDVKPGALDRRVPQSGRPSEVRIARGAQRLRQETMAQIEKLSRAGSHANAYDQGFVEAIMTDDGGPLPERESDARSRASVRNRPASAVLPHRVANANKDMTTNPTHGFSTSSSRSTGDNASPHGDFGDLKGAAIRRDSTAAAAGRMCHDLITSCVRR